MLLKRLDEVTKFGMIIILYSIIYSIVQKLFHTRVYMNDKLNYYLNNVLELKDKIAMLFIAKFCTVY